MLGRAARRRVIARAVAAWRRGRPHEAWQELDRAGLGEYWPHFQRQAFIAARRRYVSTIRKYTAE